MAGTARVKGVSRLISFLRQRFKATKQGIERGLINGAAVILRDSQKMVPVWQGNLKRSAFIRKENTTSGITVKIGYTAKYAIYVHEIPPWLMMKRTATHGAMFNAKHAERIKNAKGPAKKYWFKRGENQQYKFLEKAFRQNIRTIREIILSEAI